MDAQKHILLVEDDQFLSSLLTMRLERDGGFLITPAKTGDDAVILLTDSSKQFDLVLLDLILPGKSGFEVLEELQKNPGVHPPVIIISNLGQESDIARGKSLGAIDYFVKARTPIDELIAKIKSNLL
jgi:DNA-binding response OmpR family regulator